ncbi:hypothetical protein [Streptomyces globisporus]|uniref:hypothetical protein n=1 Tax=Streptomyces globisporus TaxID=1908 RepID=UPI002F91AB11|nr:hypothetical protein OG449_35675 [Streptomyces globisporus]
MVSGLLVAGWPVPLLWEVIARPLPDPLHRTVGAVISGRLKAAMPVPGSAAGTLVVPRQAPGPDRTAPGEGRRREDGPTPTPPAWADLEHQQEQLRHGIDRHPVCEADDGRCPTLAVGGETQCAEHLGWPLCPGHDGHPCTVRTRTGDQCATCQDQARYARLDAALPVTATCPGHTSPCGRTAMPGDPYCARCRITSQRDRDRVIQEWEAVRDAAVAAATVQEAPQRASVPFWAAISRPGPGCARGGRSALSGPRRRSPARVGKRRHDGRDGGKAKWSAKSAVAPETRGRACRLQRRRVLNPNVVSHPS